MEIASGPEQPGGIEVLTHDSSDSDTHHEDDDDDDEDYQLEDEWACSI